MLCMSPPGANAAAGLSPLCYGRKQGNEAWAARGTTRCRLRNSPQRGDHRSVASHESHTTSTASQKAEISHHRINER